MALPSLQVISTANENDTADSDHTRRLKRVLREIHVLQARLNAALWRERLWKAIAQTLLLAHGPRTSWRRHMTSGSVHTMTEVRPASDRYAGRAALALIIIGLVIFLAWLSGFKLTLPAGPVQGPAQTLVDTNPRTGSNELTLSEASENRIVQKVLAALPERDALAGVNLSAKALNAIQSGVTSSLDTYLNDNGLVVTNGFGRKSFAMQPGLSGVRGDGFTAEDRLRLEKLDSVDRTLTAIKLRAGDIAAASGLSTDDRALMNAMRNTIAAQSEKLEAQSRVLDDLRLAVNGSRPAVVTTTTSASYLLRCGDYRTYKYAPSVSITSLRARFTDWAELEVQCPRLGKDVR